ncbi:MAG: class I SAM-dependent methyltransferase [Pseudomonadota bacterium]
MLSHEEMVGLQAEKHELINSKEFKSEEEFVLHLIHSFAYHQVAKCAVGKTVLDLGCNTGYGSKILAGMAAKVIGVDVSENAVSIARETNQAPGIEFHLIDGKQLPFEADTFDVVISCQVIEHIVDYEVYIGEIQRVLTPGGIVVFTTPNALLRLDPGMKPWNPFHVTEFNADEIGELLRSHFPAVVIQGLFAKKSTYMVEKDRLSRARAAARQKAQPDKKQSKMARRFEKLFKRLWPRPASRPERFLDKHQLNDLFYRSEELDKALDLMAVCSSETPAVEDAACLIGGK